MWEDKTYENLLADKLNRVPDQYDTRESSLLFNALAPAAMETMKLYLDMAWAYDQMFPETANRENLIRHARLLGVFPKDAQPMRLKAAFDAPIQAGDRFNLDRYNFYAAEMVDTKGGVFTWILVAEEVGALDLYPVGMSLTPIKEIKDLSRAEVTGLIEPGRNEEETELFRERFFIEIQRQAYGGNIADYERMLSTVNGVGACKVLPHHKGPGTVGVIIVNDSFDVPSTELVQRVQEAIDPPGYTGEGKGLAPIDHQVTIMAAKADKVNVKLTLSYAPGSSWASLKSRVIETLRAYFDEVRRGWTSSATLRLYTSQVEMRLLKIPGIVDAQYTRFNGVDDNHTVPDGAIPVLGEVTA
ncbi:baseplate J/gp47 family protein [Peptococcus simiae]|uniref:baseplate J/gp47 family protein n=1 Tax=Peptococcus simiae TaxID=1643805 RepID=UPI0039801321